TRWTQQELAQIIGAPADIASDKVGIVKLQLSRRIRVPGQDRGSKARREPFDLRLDRRSHVSSRAIGNMTVAPGSMPAVRGACIVEKARLRNKDKGPVRMFALGHSPLRVGDFFERSADVNRGRLCALRGCPRNRLT